MCDKSSNEEEPDAKAIQAALLQLVELLAKKAVAVLHANWKQTVGEHAERADDPSYCDNKYHRSDY